ncbi:hypothetical protein CLV98_101443 [Dyadobacter jejuensis]|uniref:Uncharacterized protein n=1 Tax=Dyadobacter jejuensis TaxID=1082580 RepID=A0A316ARP6_9BACT|nr:hypothetical protein [Dyadobacter jejuensis]PWJ60262.1 hypothetical protein CLV98_101443 [Dyadobacter jejuensis]
MRIITLLVLATFWLSKAYGQTAPKGEKGPFAQAEEPVKAYKEATRYSQNLYNGRIYYWYDYRSEEHQFFQVPDWSVGGVHYDGQTFDSIQIKYDIFKDQVVIHHLNGDHMLLQTSKIDRFRVHDHTFLHLTSGKDLPAFMPTGFYDQRYTGPTALLIRRKKDRQEKIVDKRVISLYPIKDAYYVKIGGEYHQVRSKKSVLRLFPGEERAMRRALRANQIQYRKDREEGILLMIKNYDSKAI